MVRKKPVMPILILEEGHEIRVFTFFKKSYVKYFRKLTRCVKRHHKLERELKGKVLYHVLIVSPFHLPFRVKPHYAEFGNKYFIMIQI